MKILLIGSGGREHAIAWRLRQDDAQLQLFTAPGNAGTARLGTNLSISATDLDGLVAWAEKEKPDLTVVGPEAPLCAGVVDRFEKAGLPIVGPNSAAARLEGSKVFSKNLLLKHGLPTAPGKCFSDSMDAYAYSQKKTVYPQVIKADDPVWKTWLEGASLDHQPKMFVMVQIPGTFDKAKDDKKGSEDPRRQVISTNGCDNGQKSSFDPPPTVRLVITKDRVTRQ